MIQRYIPFIFFTLFAFISCDTDKDEELQPFSTDPCETITPTPEHLRYKAVYDKPVFNQTNEIYYSSERVELKWDLQEGLWNTELQMILTDKPYSCDDYGKFHEMNNTISFGYGNQYVHYHTTTEHISPVQDTIFVSYRARANDIERNQSYSLWTDVQSFTVVPLSHLKKQIITVPYIFNFTTEENGHFYYSGLVEASNYPLSQMASDNDIEYGKIRLVRLVSYENSFNTLTSSGENPFSRLVIGFKNDNSPENVFPFEPMGDVYPGSYEENPVPGTLYDNLTKNLISELDGNNLKLAYKLLDVVGTQHEISINLTFEIYSIN